MKRKHQALPAIVILLLLTTACIHKATPVTPWEKVHTYNASLAVANNAFEQGTEAVVNSGLMTAADAAPLIAASGQVALLHEQITTILATGTSTPANIAGVTALVTQIQTALAAIPPTALGIKNPKSQQTFQGDVQSIGTLANSVLQSLQAITQPVTP